MEITLRLYGALGRYKPADAPAMGAFPVEVEEGATVAGLVERLGIPPSWVRAAFVNDRQVGLGGALSPGDQVNLFPPTGGGATGMPGAERSGYTCSTLPCCSPRALRSPSES